MKSAKNLKDIAPKLILGIAISAIIITIYGTIMIFNSLKPITQTYEYAANETYIERTEIFDNLYLENAFYADSSKEKSFQSNIIYQGFTNNYNLNDFEKKIEIKKEKKNRYISLYFTAYYVIITLLWIVLFYHLFMFVTAHNVNLYFYEKNEIRIIRSSNIIHTMALIKFLGLMILSFFINITHNINLNSFQFSYESFTHYLVLTLFARLLKVISIAYKNGLFIEKEQALTV